ncbi:hypothetical protein MKW94_000300 [Papaver nudicaule]|uniref:PGG domain-containing protein n=1 Tax=Papaver nudicaule TaxID=74823 RepID=A0AA42B390_PAPNU|nr:hypothetical protein [Papaver nudicaule]
MIRYLIESSFGVELVNALNKKGLTALDILEQSSARDLKDMEIGDLLLRAQAHNIGGLVTNQTPSQALHRRVSIRRENSKIRKYEDWLNAKSNSLLVAASLLAAMAFQAAVNPPGGVWQEDTLSPLRYAGRSVLADIDAQNYKLFLIFNTLGFVFSINTVLLLVSELPLKRHFFFSYLAMSMWGAAVAMAITYIVALMAMMPSTHTYIIKCFFWGVNFKQSVVFLMIILFFMPVCYLFVKHTDYFEEKFSGEDLTELNKLEKET